MSNVAGTRNHPHPSLLPEYREKGPEERPGFRAGFILALRKIELRT